MAERVYPARARGVASRLVEGEAVLVVASRGEAHVLNETGSAVWALMDGSRTEEEIVSGLAGRYGVAEERALRDLTSFLRELEDRGTCDMLASSARSLAPDARPPEPSAYVAPAIAESEPIEVLAAVCDSSRTGVTDPPGGGGGGGKPKPPKPGKCRADDTLCKKLFE